MNINLQWYRFHVVQSWAKFRRNCASRLRLLALLLSNTPIFMRLSSSGWSIPKMDVKYQVPSRSIKAIESLVMLTEEGGFANISVVDPADR